MKKYVFSHISFFDSILTSKVIESDAPMLAIAVEEIMGKGVDIDSETAMVSMEDLKNFAFNCDSMFEIIEV